MDEYSVLGFDLSLSGTGASFVSFSERFLVTLGLRLPAFEKSYAGIFSRIEEVEGYLQSFCCDLTPTIITLEYALPRGQWAAGSFGLVSVILRWLLDEFPSAVLLYHPGYLGFIHGKRKYKKRESVDLARLIIEKEELLKGTSRLNHDEAEAFLLCYAAAVQFGYHPRYLIPKFQIPKGEIYRKPFVLEVPHDNSIISV